MKTLRCAIYTRKSSEEGLDQDFNSLHAQREACEAYVLSQVGEGWTALKVAYDDGGVSGGTMDRPGLKRLLDDIAADKIDVVVVYKVDRLTRSLMDFAKIVETFDRNQVSFVSVTQAFNTTSSMGRLTLNVLLSFAQFEREVTGERIRDKLAASKKKGLWMGGNLPLGYDADGRTLKINEPEADRVRHIFQRYLELKSVHRLAEELRVTGVYSKQRTTKAGRVIGGGPMRRGALFHLLSNTVYVGWIPHKDASYPGQHSAIVETETFEAVQALLAGNGQDRANTSLRGSEASLTGKIYDAKGRRMSPTSSRGKNGCPYRYYVSAGLQQGEAATEDRIRLPAAALETYVQKALQRLVGAKTDACISALARADVGANLLTLTLDDGAAKLPGEASDQLLARISSHLQPGERAWLQPKGLSVAIPVRLQFRGGRRLIEGHGAPDRKSDRILEECLRRAHRIVSALGISQVSALPAEPASAPDTYARRLASLAYLAPDLQRFVFGGDVPTSLTRQRLLAIDLPLSWEAQRRKFGL